MFHTAHLFNLYALAIFIYSVFMVQNVISMKMSGVINMRDDLYKEQTDKQVDKFGSDSLEVLLLIFKSRNI